MSQNDNRYWDDYTVLIYGKSKSGKSHSLENLDRTKMSYINIEAKPLSISGGKKLSRYSEPSTIKEFMSEVKASAEDPNVEFIVIDSLTKLGDEIVYQELVKELIESKGKKYAMEGWQNYKDFFTQMLKFCKRSRKHFIFIGLEDTMTSEEDSFEKEICVAIQGATKKKLVSDFTNVFRANAMLNKDKKLEYTFQCRRTADNYFVQCGSLKCFNDYEPNDMAYIFEKMKKHYNGD
jgi:hypothetical protein